MKYKIVYNAVSGDGVVYPDEYDSVDDAISALAAMLHQMEISSGYLFYIIVTGWEDELIERLANVSDGSFHRS